MSRFISTTVAGFPVFLLMLQPDWTDDVSVQHKFRASVSEGMTTVDSRRPRATALAHTVAYSLTLTGTDADDYRQALPLLTTQLIAVPMPCDVDGPQASSGFIYNASQQWINFNPVSGAHQVLPLSSVVAPAGGLLVYSAMAPLLFGRIAQRPEHEIIDQNTVRVKLTIEEQSPWVLRMGVSVTSPTWTAFPSWISDPKEQSELQTSFKQLGFARDSVVEYQDAAARWLQTGEFLFNGKAEIRQHIAFFYQQKGEVTSWASFPAWCTPGANTTTDPSTMTVRFASDTLELKYTGADGWVATSDVGFLQEIYTPTIAQAQPPLAVVARVTYQCAPAGAAWPAGSNYVEHYADWDAPLTIGAETFNPWPMTIKGITRSIELQEDSIELQMAFSPASLFAYWIREWSDFPILVELFFASPDSLTDPLIPLYAATVASVDPKGSVVTVNATFAGGAMKRNAIGWLFQTSCNATLFDQNCGLAAGSFKSSGVLVTSTGISADGMTLTITSASGWKGFGSPGNWVDGMFAYGFLVVDGADAGGTTIAGNAGGVVPVLRAITNSTATGTTLTISLSQPITSDRLAAGSYRVTLFPGCSGQNGYIDPATISNPVPSPIAIPPACTCAFFGNYQNFQAFPFIPAFVSQTVIGAPKTGK